MDTSLVIISVLVVIAVFGPIYFINHTGNSDRKKLVREFNNLAKQYELSISEFEAWGDKAIGFDAVAKQLLYVRKLEAEFHHEIISLAEVSKCEPVVKYKFLKSKNGNSQILEEAFLSFNLKKSGNSSPQIFFFDQETETMPNLEEKRLEKWHKTLFTAA